MKMKRFLILGIVLIGLTLLLFFFTIASYPQMKEIEDRALYLNSLDWYVEPEEDVYFLFLDYGNENLIYSKTRYDKNIGETVDTVGVVTPTGQELIPCSYEEIVYYGGDYFAAATKDGWIIFDFNGRIITSMKRDDEHLFYAGGKDFIWYENFEKKGFSIIDGVSGQVKETFDTAYSGRCLPDGIWYISESISKGDFDRVLFDSELGMKEGELYFQDNEVGNGYFLDENMKPMYDRKSYILKATGDGLYAASQVDNGILGDFVLLDQEGVWKKISGFSPFGSDLNQNSFTATLNRSHCLTSDKDGNIGIRFARGDERFGTVCYYDDYGQELYSIDVEKHGLHVNANEEGWKQLVDAEGSLVLEPWFDEIELLPGGGSAIIWVDGKHGIVNLKGVN